MYDYEYENNVLLFLRLLKFLHTDQPEVLEEIIKDYPMAGDEDIEMIMNELMLTVFDEGAPDDEDDMVTVRFSHDYISALRTGLQGRRFVSLSNQRVAGENQGYFSFLCGRCLLLCL